MKKNSNQLLLNFILCFLGFSIPMGIFFIIVSMSVVKGIVLGVIAGLLFAGFCTIFTVCVAAGKGKLKERYGITEQAIYDGGASHIMGKVSIGGWMYMFEDRVCFLPHRFNAQVGQIIMPYKDIHSVAMGTKWRRITIQTKDGNIIEFIVNEASEWVEMLQKKIFI